ncbi:UNVERIFIED_CONTAM: hypothetical protein GTU68_018099 [Idotea baltica]|nr:hypothetical protein [Idotea baltica]
MKIIKRECSVEVYENETSFTDIEKKLFAATRAACLKAYAPYSKFKVGAALLLADGEIVIGNNQENAAYPSGLCAERVAIFHAGANKPNTPITAIAITIDYDVVESKDFVFPCGACRQSMIEYEMRHGNKIPVYLLGPNNTIGKVDSVQALMPFYFDRNLLPE